MKTRIPVLMLAKLSLAGLALFIFLTCVSSYPAYTPYGDDFAWILHCDRRFASVAEWFTRGSMDYHINYPGLVTSFTPNFRPLTASFYYLASFFHPWTGYKSQLALNHVLFIVGFWAYLKFLRRFTPLPAVIRCIVGGIFLVSPVWSIAYFDPSRRVHLLQCACTLLGSLLLPRAAGGSLFRRVVPAAIVSAGAVFAHELGGVAPLLVAWTHYHVQSGARDLRKRAAGEASLIVAISLGLYFAVRLAFFHQPAQSAYPLQHLFNAKSLVVAVLNLPMRLFFPFDTYVASDKFLGGHGTLIGWSMVLFTLAIYVVLAGGLLARNCRFRGDLRMLTACTVIAAAPLVLANEARQMGILLIYCLPLVYLALECFLCANEKRMRIRPLATALLAGACTIYIATGIQSFLKARASADLESRYSRSLQRVLVSAMKRGANRLFLINDLPGQYGSLAMLQLTAKENGATLVDPAVVNQLSLGKYDDATPAQDTGVLAECRGGVVSIQIELAAGRAFEFTFADPHMLLTRANASGGRYEFPYVHQTQYRTRLTRSSAERIDLGSRLVFTAPTVCSSVGVVGFPARGQVEPRIFLLGAQQGPQVQN